MNNFMKYKWAGILGLLLLAACSKDNLTPPIDKTTVPRNMGTFIENNYDLSLLSAALKKTGLLDSLNQAGAITFFAPDNAAFNRIGISTPEEIDRMDVDSLRFMLRYHMIRDRYFISTFPRQMDNKYTTLAGEKLYVSTDKVDQYIKSDLYTFVNGAFIMGGAKRNIALANGVIHILYRPIQFYKMTVQDYIAKDTSFSLFTAAMKQFGLWEELKTKNPLTVYVPVNSAFEKYGITAAKIAAMKPAAYKPIVFAIYAMQMRPMHIFSADGYIIGGTNVFGSNVAFLDGGYGIAPAYFHNSNENTESVSLNIGMMYGLNWGANPDGPSHIPYAGSMMNTDHLCTNGIVHVISDLMLNPDLMKQ
ncbi:fasciclin domain-containing protein [Chitinophaga arvensicola]|uniref:Fasciclin domain-containing protein n=1 Tax=Chitinophaga arvensicola TaxID=29529 RepID=A0A1I0SB88_9BACT|nr:fasciclin domain-containing protein [Chitinophaga arvensicola]SEW53917.1 Fasciclin domain-containing protein [Chitinophaga arvensicola]